MVITKNCSKKFYIGFSTSNSWISRAIRFFQKAPYSHVFVLFTDKYLDMEIVAEADWCGYVLTPYEVLKRKSKVVKLYEITEPLKFERGLKETLKKLRTSYDFAGLLKYAFVIGLKWLGFKIKWPFRDTKEVMCTEITIQTLQESDIENSDKLHKEFTDLVKLDNFLKECKGCKKCNEII